MRQVAGLEPVVLTRQVARLETIVVVWPWHLGIAAEEVGERGHWLKLWRRWHLVPSRGRRLLGMPDHGGLGRWLHDPAPFPRLVFGPAHILGQPTRVTAWHIVAFLQSSSSAPLDKPAWPAFLCSQHFDLRLLKLDGLLQLFQLLVHHCHQRLGHAGVHGRRPQGAGGPGRGR